MLVAGRGINIAGQEMSIFTKMLTIGTLAVTLSVATLAVTSPADAGPGGNVRTVSSLDLGRSR